MFMHRVSHCTVSQLQVQLENFRSVRRRREYAGGLDRTDGTAGSRRVGE